MATVELCSNRNGEFVNASMEDLPRLLADDLTFIWIDVDPDRQEEINLLKEQFDLHTIAVDNAVHGSGRARIMLFDDQIYIRSFGLRRDLDSLEVDPISLFCGERFLVTVRKGARPSLAAIQDRWREEVRRKQSHPGNLSVAGAGNGATAVPTSVKLLYAALDDLVDHYFTVIEDIADDVEALEDRVMDDHYAHQPRSIQNTRAEINRLHRMLSPQQEVFNTLMRRDVPVIDAAIIPYFADVHDHLLRCREWLDTCRDQITSIIDLEQSVQANRLNRTMRTLTVWSIILMFSGLIAGIYGMNFRYIPELDWRLGYPIALASMVISAGVLGLVFRRMHWW